MRIRSSKHIWLSAAIVAVVVLGIALHLWLKSGNQNEQAITIPAPADERSSEAVSQYPPGSTPNMFANKHLASSEPAVTPGLTENSGKQSDTVGAWERFLKNETDERQVHKFIDSLSDDELLILMEYCCSSNQIPAVKALLIPALKQRWGKDVPFEKLLDIVAATDQDDTFRVILTNFATVYGRSAELPTRDMIAARLMQIITSRDEAAELRGSVIMYLSGLLQEGVSAQTAYSDAFLNTLKDSSEDPKVVAAAITASRRLGDKRAVPILVEKCLRDGDDLSRDVASATSHKFCP